MALGLAFILEGLMPALLPKQWKNFVEKLAQENVYSVRQKDKLLVTGWKGVEPQKQDPLFSRTCLA